MFRLKKYDEIFNKALKICIDKNFKLESNELAEIILQLSPEHLANNKTIAYVTWYLFESQLLNYFRYDFKSWFDGNIVMNIIPKCKKTIEKDIIFYRARIHETNVDMYGVEDMKMPPRKVAKDGRLSPKNIPHLYVCSDKDTCVLEVKPWVGAKITIAEVRCLKQFEIIDLTHSFDGTMNSTDYYLWKIISEKMSLPNSENRAENYFSTQYIAELIKKEGYDGIEFKSAQGEGYCLSFFSEEQFSITPINVVEVESLCVQYSIQ